VHEFQRRRAPPCRNVSESTDMLDLTLRPSKKSFEDLTKLRRTSKAMERARLHLAMDPVLSLAAEAIGELREWPVMEICLVDVDLKMPSWIVQGLDPKDICVLPVPVAVLNEPRLQAFKCIHREV